jgi:hypothetical protein
MVRPGEGRRRDLPFPEEEGMNPKDRPGESRTERDPDRGEPRERTVAPPIEREHETQEGALEEEEDREPERN